jgi:hypothetical protein
MPIYRTDVPSFVEKYSKIQKFAITDMPHNLVMDLCKTCILLITEWIALKLENAH